MSVLRELYDHLQVALAGSKPVTVNEVGGRLKIELELFGNLKAFLGALVRLESVEKKEPAPRPLPRHPGSRQRGGFEKEEPASETELGVDLGARPRGTEDELRSVLSSESSVGVFLESRDTSRPRSSQELEFEADDCHRVDICGHIADGPRVVATAWHAPSGVELRVVFDNFPESAKDFLDALFGHPYSAELDPLVLSNQRIVFCTTKTQLLTPHARVRIHPGINVVFDAELPAGLGAMLVTGTQDSRLSFFGVLPPEDDATIILFSAPLFRLESKSLHLQRGFLRMNARLENAEDEDGGFRAVRVTVRGHSQVGEKAITLYGPLVYDHQLLQLMLMEKSVIAPLNAFDSLMGGNSAWRDVLANRLQIPEKEVELVSYARHIEQSSGRVVSVACGIRVPKGIIKRSDAQFTFQELRLGWTVGFPEEGPNAQIHVSAVGIATVLAQKARMELPNVPITMTIQPKFEWVVSFGLRAKFLPEIRRIFGIVAHRTDSQLGEGDSEVQVLCSLRFPAQGDPSLEVWRQEEDA